MSFDEVDYNESINRNLHDVTIPDFGTFKVLHENDIAGPGWTVIQQWTNGGADEQRDWEEYKNGFGDFEGDMFIGLEKIHRLTSDKPHELYIHMREYDGDTFFAHYSNFRIAGEDDKYRLITLGLYSGNAAEDGMIWHEHKHSSLDREEDVKDFLHCVSRRNGGWWYDILTLYSCNPDGKYYHQKSRNPDSDFWDHTYTLKSTKMMIRPREKCDAP